MLTGYQGADYQQPVLISTAATATNDCWKEQRTFALNDDRPLAAFAGIWTEFKGDRGTKSKPVPGPHLVWGDQARRG